MKSAISTSNLAGAEATSGKFMISEKDSSSSGSSITGSSSSYDCV